MMNPKRLSVICVLALAGSAAHATLFSFASDVGDTQWTWTGSGGSMSDGLDATNPLTLLIDDDNGVLPTLEFDAEFGADFTIEHVSSEPVDGAVLHLYSVDGAFSFTDVDSGAVLLSATFSNGVLSAVGTDTTWGSNAAVIASDTFTDVVYTSGLTFPDYGLFEGASIGPDDFSFDLTVLNTSGDIPFGGDEPGVPLGSDLLPGELWFAEGSFSGSASFIPSPGTAALFGLAGLGMIRRRR